jgi:hypothetical protein
MRKYRLIKEYPGSPKLGHIISCQNYIKHPSTEIHNASKYPEFWEEIIEKNYEILSFLGKITQSEYVLDEETNLYKNKTLYRKVSKEELLRKDCTIHSVKRLSDGEVFTVGDKIRHNNNVIYPEGIITKLHIVSDVIFVETNNRERGFDTNISLVHKLYKKKLFCTEDGVDIFEGDKYWSVWIEEVYINTKPFKVNGCFKAEDCMAEDLNKIKFFSTKEAAEEYIIMNIPCLSINELCTIIAKSKL